jgi:hypothetical protein
MIEKIDHNQVQDIIEQGAAKVYNAAKTEQQDQADASLQADYASLITKALSPDDDSLAVQNAKNSYRMDYLIIRRTLNKQRKIL